MNIFHMKPQCNEKWNPKKVLKSELTVCFYFKVWGWGGCVNHLVARYSIVVRIPGSNSDGVVAGSGILIHVNSGGQVKSDVCLHLTLNDDGHLSWTYKAPISLAFDFSGILDSKPFYKYIFANILQIYFLKRPINLQFDTILQASEMISGNTNFSNQGILLTIKWTGHC